RTRTSSANASPLAPASRELDAGAVDCDGDLWQWLVRRASHHGSVAGAERAAMTRADDGVTLHPGDQASLMSALRAECLERALLRLADHNPAIRDDDGA